MTNMRKVDFGQRKTGIYILEYTGICKPFEEPAWEIK